jgi:hypothetical protein
LVFETQIRTFECLGRNSLLEEIFENTLNRFLVCEIKTFVEGFLFFQNLFQYDFLETFGPFERGSFRNQFRFIHFFTNGLFGKRCFEIASTRNSKPF